MFKVTKSSNKRQHILNAAMSLFSCTHDVKRVSLEDIAEKAAVSPTTIYNNFGNRETLIYELIKTLVRQNLGYNSTIIHSDLPFPQKIISIMRNKMDIAGKINSELIEKLVTQDKKIAPFINEIYTNEIKPLWQELTAEGKKQGYIDQDLDNRALLAYLDIMQAGIKARPEIFKNLSKNKNVIEQITRLMFCGLLKKNIDIFQKEGAKTHE